MSDIYDKCMQLIELRDTGAVDSVDEVRLPR